jgi:hypothetical protein
VERLWLEKKNMELMLKHYSIEEYAAFYDAHFTTLPYIEESEDALDEIRFED